jgi:hypothetical protein
VFGERPGEFEEGFLFTAQTAPNRRFSGGDDLPRQRYYSISEDALGTDSMSLMSEMRAYRSVKKSVLCTLLDTRYSIPKFLAESFGIGQTQMRSMLLVFCEGPELHNPFLEELDLHFRIGRRYPLSGEEDGQMGMALITIPYQVVHAEIPRVFDLRSLTSQEWLFHAVCIERGIFPVHVSFDNPRASFTDLLPWLMSMELGGGGLTEAIGRWLRRNGVDALIYPSARSDPFAIYLNGAAVKSAGWCLVDYRNPHVPVPDHDLFDLSVQTPFPFGKSPRVVSWQQPSLHGSWATEGVRHLYRYRFYKELEDVVGAGNHKLLQTLLRLEGEFDDFERFSASSEHGEGTVD